MKCETYTMDNGMRVVWLPSQSEVVYCGIAVKAGTRDEQPGEEGLAHFCEHLAFKGTTRRTATQIINAIEGVGGELNAFTNKENTVFYCVVQAKYFRRAADVLMDIVFGSTFPQHEVEKEREVVCDEIESYEDSPAELIFDEMENILFEGHPLGHNTLGTSEQVRTYTADDARRFTQRNYRPENCVFFVNGKATPPSKAPSKAPSKVPSNLHQLGEVGGGFGGGRTIIRQRGTHQAHVVVGTKAYAADDPRRWALYLLNNILGGPGLNSRLNMALRERNALVYSVESSMVCYGDTGAWSVYFGCDQHDVKRCRRLVRRELDKLMEKPLSPAQLKRAKEQMKGQLAIVSDNREQTTLDFVRTFLYTGEKRSVADVMGYVDALTAEDLLTVARELFDEKRLTTLIYL